MEQVAAPDVRQRRRSASELYLHVQPGTWHSLDSPAPVPGRPPPGRRARAQPSPEPPRQRGGAIGREPRGRGAEQSASPTLLPLSNNLAPTQAEIGLEVGPNHAYN